MKILVFSKSFFEIASFSRALLKDGHVVIFAPTEIEAITFMEELKIDILLCDDQKLAWVKRLLARMPNINIALFSDIEEKVFHQMTEGLGIVTRLPQIPEKSEAGLLLERLRRISALLPA